MEPTETALDGTIKIPYKFLRFKFYAIGSGSKKVKENVLSLTIFVVKERIWWKMGGPPDIWHTSQFWEWLLLSNTGQKLLHQLI